MHSNLLNNKPYKLMRELNRKRVTSDTTGESLTVQSDRTKTDINNLLKRGFQPPDPNQMRFRDFSDGADFRAVQDALIEAREAFLSLPSDLRRQFDNDPGQLIDFVNDPSNQAEAVQLGLISEPADNQQVVKPDRLPPTSQPVDNQQVVKPSPKSGDVDPT